MIVKIGDAKIINIIPELYSDNRDVKKSLLELKAELKEKSNIQKQSLKLSDLLEK